MIAPASGHRRPAPRLHVLLALSVLVLAAACDRVPLTAPSGSTVTLFSNTTIVPVNGTAEITATVVESGGTLAQNGTLVTFTTTIGTIEPSEARTHDGKATVRLIAGNRSGRAIIRAFSGGITSGDLTVNIGGAAAGRITLNANPSTVPITGGTSTITAVVFDVDGNRLPGVPVSFSATAGSLLNTVVVTNGDGVAQTTITTNRETEVTATAGGAGGGGGEDGEGPADPIEQTITISVTTLPTVGVTTTGTNLSAGQPVSFTVTATAPEGSAVREVTVDFGDGTRQSLGSATGSTTVAHVYSSPGSYTVTATVEDTNGQRVSASTVVVIMGAAPVLVTLTGPTQLQVGQVGTFTVSVNQTTPAVESVAFDFGDGNRREPAPSLSTTHIYGARGDYLVRATVRFVDGTSSQASVAVAVR
ncbi:MAG TPA: PKD domain-containing protein [Vicinamibacterales bacterium]